MKLSQLMPAGDYLSYKGDWVTNTAYNVNECVTWTDGHLYQVIKEHTSSSTIDPSNTEYYKAMTATKYTQYSLNLSTQSGRDRLISLCQAANQGKNIKLKKEGNGEIYPLTFVTENAANFATTILNVSSDIDAQTIITIKCKTSSANQYLVRTPINGTSEKNTFTLSNVILFIEN